MEEEQFIRKYGAAWHPPSSEGTVSIRFAEFPLEGIDQDYTYHVDRGKFDLALLKHAEGLGTEVLQGVAVSEVLFDEQGFACGVKANVGGQTVELKSKIVVDASGRDTFLGRHLRLKKKDPIFNQYAIHTWFENVDRGTEETRDYIHIYFLPIERGWVWQIPITRDITSIGVVVERKDFAKAKGDLKSFFYEHVQSTPDLVHAMRDSRQIRDFTTEGDYSYSLSQFVGDGYVIVGDAARFVDPIFSSGISVALNSGKFASEVIVEALQKNDVRAEVFKPYELRLREGVEIWYEFIRLYYKLLPLFTYFIQTPKYRLQIFRLLQGEVYNRAEAPVLDAMQEYIEKVEQTDTHVFRRALTDIPLGDLSFVPDFIAELDAAEPGGSVQQEK
jgi:FADH2 O2-dependent halogenase